MPIGTGWAAQKAQMRGVVHETFRVAALYTDAAELAPIGIHIRWHNRLIRPGNLGAAGYAELFEGVNRLVFDQVELSTRTIDADGQAWGGIELTHGGVLVVPDYAPVAFSLDTLEPVDGPREVIWGAVRADI